MSDRPRQLLDDVLGWPTALDALLDAYERPDGPLAAVDGIAARQVVVTGLGSSRYAAMTVVATLRAAGLQAWTEPASPEAPTRPSADTVVFAVSASGTTPEVVDAVRRHRIAGAVIGVTNRPDSPVAVEADHVLPLLAGSETAGVATRTYGATLAVLGLAAARLGGRGPTVDDLRVAVGALRRLHRSRGPVIARAADLLDGAPSIDIVAGTRRPGSAAQGALLLREGPRLPAVAHDATDWSHVAVYTALPGHRSILFTGSAADADVIRTVARRGGETLAVGDRVSGAARTIGIPLESDAHPVTRAIVEIAAVELLAAELWDRATASG
jgi:fructoselysine-6-P-deglycase FrlB-like protein